MTSLGTQLLADLFGCDATLLDDEAHIRRSMLDAALRCGATVVADRFHRFSPQGVSGVVVIAESHLTIHTWPEQGYAAIDVFTCGAKLRPGEAVRYLVEALRSDRQRLSQIARGEATEEDGVLAAAAS